MPTLTWLNDDEARKTSAHIHADLVAEFETIRALKELCAAFQVIARD